MGELPGDSVDCYDALDWKDIYVVKHNVCEYTPILRGLNRTNGIRSLWKGRISALPEMRKALKYGKLYNNAFRDLRRAKDNEKEVNSEREVDQALTTVLLSTGDTIFEFLEKTACGLSRMFLRNDL